MLHAKPVPVNGGEQNEQWYYCGGALYEDIIKHELLEHHDSSHVTSNVISLLSVVDNNIAGDRTTDLSVLSTYTYLKLTITRVLSPFAPTYTSIMIIKGLRQFPFRLIDRVLIDFISNRRYRRFSDKRKEEKS